MQSVKYILQALYVLRSHHRPLVMLIALILLLALSMGGENVSVLSFFLPVLLLVFALPLVYGRYAELVVYNRHSPYSQIFQTHWFNFIAVNIILGVPVLFFTMLAGSTGGLQWVGSILPVAVDIAAIYMIPLVFISREKWGSIVLGFKCLIGNAEDSVPLAVLTAIPSILALMAGQGTEPTGGPFITVFLPFLVVITDLIVFVAATLILKEKLLVSGKVPGKETNPRS